MAFEACGGHCDNSKRPEKASAFACLLLRSITGKDILTPLLLNVILEMFANKLSSFL